jgi:hypothetical protein
MTRREQISMTNKLQQERTRFANRLTQEANKRASEAQLKIDHENRLTSQADKSKTPKQKRYRANHPGRRSERTPFFNQDHFAQNPKARKKPRRLTARVTRLG